MEMIVKKVNKKIFIKKKLLINRFGKLIGAFMTQIYKFMSPDPEE